jgi:predicted transcriptional regulator
MNTIEKINLILKKTNISKVNLAKYLGVSRQMVYNYLDSNDLNKMPAEKCQLLFKLLEVNSCEEIVKKELTDDYLQNVSNKIFNYRKIPTKKEEIIELSGLKKEEQELISDIVFLIKEMFNEDTTKDSYNTINYFYHSLQSIPSMKELKYILGYVAKNCGYIKADTYDFNKEQQFVFESIMYSAMTLYTNGGASKSKIAESHHRWEADLERKNEEKLSRTQELNTAKVQALRELGYTEITEKNASEVFDKIAEIQARNFI